MSEKARGAGGKTCSCESARRLADCSPTGSRSGIRRSARGQGSVRFRQVDSVDTPADLRRRRTGSDTVASLCDLRRKERTLVQGSLHRCVSSTLSPSKRKKKGERRKATYSVGVNLEQRFFVLARSGDRLPVPVLGRLAPRSLARNLRVVVHPRRAVLARRVRIVTAVVAVRAVVVPKIGRAHV